ncbi:MAG: alpha/beta hydrolase [Actinomycetota bacterium]
MTEYGAVIDPEWSSAVREELHPVDGSPVFTARTPAPDATPTLLLHGIGNNGAVFSPLLARMARHGPVAATTMSVELLLEADGEDPDSFDDLIEWLAAVHPPPWRLIGHSMGGVLTGLLLRLRPDLASSAVLLNSPLPSAVERISFGDSIDRTGRAILAMKALARVSSFGRPRLPGFLRGTELGIVRTGLRGFVIDPGELDDDVIATAIMDSRTTDGLDFLRLAQKLPVWASRPHAAQPITVILGDDDPLILEADHAAIRRSYPEARIHVAQRCGHFVHLEQPELVMEVIDDFIAATDD